MHYYSVLHVQCHDIAKSHGWTIGSSKPTNFATTILMLVQCALLFSATCTMPRHCQVTWLDDRQFQTHQLCNHNINASTVCITIQCYMYNASDNSHVRDECPKMKACVECKVVDYCGEYHQKLAWKRGHLCHKVICPFLKRCREVRLVMEKTDPLEEVRKDFFEEVCAFKKKNQRKLEYNNNWEFWASTYQARTNDEDSIPVKND